MDTILLEISDAAARHKFIKGVILFGSRARGDNRPRSDIDLSVYADGDIYDFIEDIEENVHTLLEFDISDMRGEFDDNFIDQIEKDGVVIYEQS